MKSFYLAAVEVRKDARAGEVDALKNAKAVLSGADFSLMQTRTVVGRLRGHAATTRCGPNTKIHVSQSENAAGTAIYQEIEGVVDGQCVFRGNPTMKSVKFCGPGTLTLSRMSCGLALSQKGHVYRRGPCHCVLLSDLCWTMHISVDSCIKLFFGCPNHIFTFFIV